MGFAKKIRGMFRQPKRLGPLRPRLVLWTIVFGVVFGVLQIGAPLEIMLRGARDLLRDQRPSGQFVVVGVDDRSLSAVSAWPWPRHLYGTMTQDLFRLGAKRVFFDLDFSSPSAPAEDEALERSIAPFGRRVVLASRGFADPNGNRLDWHQLTDTFPLPRFTRHAAVGNINFRYWLNGLVMSLPYAREVGGHYYPTFATMLANKPIHGIDEFRIDFSTNPDAIPRVSAIDVLNNKVPAKLIAGRDIIIGTRTDQVPDTYYAPGRGRMPGVYFHVLGAETLLKGVPKDLGWLPPFLFAAAVAIGGMFLRRGVIVIPLMLGTLVGLLLLPFAIEPSLIYIDVVPALATMLILTGIVSWRDVRRLLKERATINAISGLRNLNALRLEVDRSNRALIIARVHNFAEAIAALPATAEKILVAQIASRLTLGTPDVQLYQGDDGVFAWFADGDVASIGEHLEALYAVFRSPVIVDGAPIDLSLTFGMDIGFDRSVANRLGSALVAAGEAADDGGKWKQFDTASLKDAAWKLSLLSQLDAAIDGGDLWVAYQPKLDLATNTVVGAEALCRWTHPEKGAISPIEFVAAAEQHNRIEKLTLHVLDRAILAATTINGHGIPFNIAVNLSPRLLEEPGLVDSIRGLLVQHQLPPSLLTLEITETATLANGPSLEILQNLRDLGITISIDDYGTGLSTLEYLKKIPASEIKIDKSFVQSMASSASDLLMVNSTIQLAHSLGHKVVAEGVETEDMLERLTDLQCDIAQGYFIGRPMTFQALARRLVSDGRQVA